MSKVLALSLLVIFVAGPTTLLADAPDLSEKTHPSCRCQADTAGKVSLDDARVLIRKGVPWEKDASSPALPLRIPLRHLSGDPHKGDKSSGPYEILIYHAPSDVDYRIAEYTPPPGVKYEMRYYGSPGAKGACVPDGEIILRLPKDWAPEGPLKDSALFLRVP